MENYWSEQTRADLDALFDRVVVAIKESERPDMETKGYLAGARMAFKVQLWEIVGKDAAGDALKKILEGVEWLKDQETAKRHLGEK